MWQKTLTGKAATEAKGTLRKASLLNGTFGVFAVSVYDNKPVHILSTVYTDSDWVMKERKWFNNGEVTVRVYRRLLLIDLYNQYMDGVDLKDQLGWYYRFCGKRMWRTQKWPWAFFQWVLNSALVQSYITHVMLKRDAAAAWTILFEVWRRRRSRLRSGRETSTEELEEAYVRTHGSKPRPMSHLNFRIHVFKRWSIPPVDQTPQRSSARRRSTPGRPAVSAMPMRSLGRKSKAMTTTGGQRKRRAGRNDSLKRLTTSGGAFDLSSLVRFRGQRHMPGVHVRFDLPRGRECNVRCQVCQRLGSPGKYGLNGDLQRPPRAKFTCKNPDCGGLAFCSAHCDNIWHVHPDELKGEYNSTYL